MQTKDTLYLEFDGNEVSMTFANVAEMNIIIERFKEIYRLKESEHYLFYIKRQSKMNCAA